MLVPEAFAAMISSICNMITEIVKGQPVEVKKQLWDWYVKDIQGIRKAFKIDE